MGLVPALHLHFSFLFLRGPGDFKIKVDLPEAPVYVFKKYFTYSDNNKSTQLLQRF